MGGRQTSNRILYNKYDPISIAAGKGNKSGPFINSNVDSLDSIIEKYQDQTLIEQLVIAFENNYNSECLGYRAARDDQSTENHYTYFSYG